MYMGPLFKAGGRRSAKDAGVVPDRHGFIVAFEKHYAQVESAIYYVYFKANGMIVWQMASHSDVSLMLSSFCCRCVSAGNLARLRGYEGRNNNTKQVLLSLQGGH
jgi:hypothetical protein